MRYLVTGATGFIGSHVARQLRDAGHEVRTIARDLRRAETLRQWGVEVFPGDITDRASLPGPMTGVDGVFHLAAWYKIGAKDRSPAERINVEGTRNVLEVALERKVPKVVHTSTVAVFSDTRGQVPDENYRFEGKFLSEYERTKWKAHYEVALPMIQRGLPLVIVQPGAVYGPGDTSELHELVVAYLRGKLWAMPRATAFCFAHVDDTARGHILAMERGVPGQTYLLTGECATVQSVLERAATLTGIPAPKYHPSTGFVRFLGRLSGSEKLKAASATYLGSNAKAVRELGFSPRPLAAGLPDLLQYEMRHLGMTKVG